MCVLSVLVSRPQWLNYAIAGRAGSHHTYVVFLERRDRKPTIDVVERVARAVGKKLSTLIAEAERARKDQLRPFDGKNSYLIRGCSSSTDCLLL
jgi:transcriptional regulator with XRE-family HTH domain